MLWIKRNLFMAVGGLVAIALLAVGGLYVSGGLGTSPWAPARFACRPEATLLTLVPRTTP